MKRSALVVALLLVGCAQDTPSGHNIGPGDPDPNAGLYACHSDADCADPGEAAATCAANGACLAIRVVHVTWTVSGQPASAATCTAAPQLDLTFWHDDEGFSYSPVPCAGGAFTVDNFPVPFTYIDASANLVRDGDTKGGALALWDYATGTATFDLPYEDGDVAAAGR